MNACTWIIVIATGKSSNDMTTFLYTVDFFHVACST